MSESIQITIDGIQTEASSDETILSVATRLGISIPILCYMKGFKQLESCGLCLVEVEGQSSNIPACASRVTPGMEVRTDSPALRQSRKMALELLLSDHIGDCVAPCELACPANIDIPGFLRQIRKGHPVEALKLIRERIAFPGVLGRICPKFCEKVCRRALLDEPVAICTLKRYPAEESERTKTALLPEKKSPTGKRVAVVGAGIVGLTAAWYLLQEGHECILYESNSQPGGALRHYLPEFRLPAMVIESEIQHIMDLGAQLILSHSLGQDLALESLRKDYDAVLIATGATQESKVEFPGSEYASSCLELLRKVKNNDLPNLGDSALVFGSGPAAQDACRTLIRLNTPKTTFAMNRSLQSNVFFMPQIQDALEEGVVILEKSDLVKIEKINERLYRCHLLHDGNPVVQEVGSVFITGAIENDLDFLKRLGLRTTEQGIQVDPTTLATNLEGVFAAGNVVRPGRFAVHASASGRQAADAIASYLAGSVYAPKKPVYVRMGALSGEEKALLFQDHPEAPRSQNERLDLQGRKNSFAEVDRGLSGNDAIREALRCLDCDCAAKNDCDLRIQSTEYEANPNAFKGEKPAFERDLSHDEVIYESGKCIKCGRCIAIAANHKESLGLSYVGRGFSVKVEPSLGGTMKEALSKVALECVRSCPTGALSRKR